MRLSDKYPFLANYFIQAISASDRAFPQSILFYGNDLDAQYVLATEIARLLNCSEDKSDDCECLNCRWINEGKHPAIMTISRSDNKPQDDDSKKVISVKQSQMIKDVLMSASDYHRVFIFCDKDDDGNVQGLNPLNFQDETANSLLKIIEEPQPGVTFIFLTRYINDVLPTIISRSQCFFVPAGAYDEGYDYSLVESVFRNYFERERKEVFDISQNLQDLTKTYSVDKILVSMQNYVFSLLKSNPERVDFIKHIEYIEDAKKQAKLDMKSVNIFDDLCLKMIK